MWTHINSASLESNQLDLYERNGVHMIRTDGWELMNGEYHVSEDQLGRLAGLLPSTAHRKIRVGGIGLLRGFPGTQLGRRDDESPPPVLRHPPSWLHRLVQSPVPPPGSVAQQRNLGR